jgi:hypothetical protein
MLPLVAFAGVAAAAPVFGPTNVLQSMEFGNFENNYRSDASCSANPGTCLPNGTVIPAGTLFPFSPSFTISGAPTGYQLVNPTIPNNVLVGDLFIGIFEIGRIYNGATGTTWNNDNVAAGGIDTLTGYFVQQVTAVSTPPVDPFDAGQTLLNHISLGVAADPFGILQAGEMFRIYRDATAQGDPGTVFSATGPIGTNIASATDGTLWAALGPAVGLCDEPSCTTGYAYTHADLSLVLNSFDGRGFIGLNNLLLGPAYNAGDLQPINDNQENESILPGGGGGFATPPATGICVGFPGTFLCNDYILTSELEINSDGQFAGGSSPWQFASNDPVRLFIPEPGTLMLLGAAMVALGMRRRRSV